MSLTLFDPIVCVALALAGTLPPSRVQAQSDAVPSVASQDGSPMALEEAFLFEEDAYVEAPTKSPTKRRASPLAVTVITRDEIRRSGARSLAALLDRVVGIETATLTLTDTQISPRGNAAVSSGTMLLVIDGVSFYDEFFSVVRWGALPIVPEDIERIEIVKGPAGSLYGANALRGVVSITTTSATEPGGLLLVGGGNRDSRTASLRWAGALAGGWHLKTAFAFDEARSLETPAAGLTRGKGLERGRGYLTLLREDGEGDEASQLELSLRLVDAPRTSLVLPPAIRIDEELVEGSLRYERGASRFLGDVSFNSSRYALTLPQHTEFFKTTLSFEHRLLDDERDDLLVGAEARFLRTRSRNTFSEPKQDAEFGVFGSFQHELAERLTTHASLRLENDPAGKRIQASPFLSLVGELGDDRFWRVSAGRSWRNPSQVQSYADVLFDSVLGPIRVLGDARVRSQHLDSVEIGYETPLGAGHFLSLTAYHDWLGGRISTDAIAPGTVRFANNHRTRTAGVEAEDRFALWTEGTGFLSYAYQDSHGEGEGLTTPHTVKGGFTARFAERLVADLSCVWRSGRRHEPVGALSTGPRALPSQTLLTGRLGYRLTRDAELGLNVWNALDTERPMIPGGGEPELRFWVDLRLSF